MQTTEEEIRIGEADFPKPFRNGLEFNAPVHGTWNIVHIGFQMPGAIQIYICARNCMRGVVLTAAEMNASDRFSFVILEEEDMIRGNLDDVTIEGVIDVIEKRTKAGMRPEAAMIFPVCVHHFLGTDYRRMYRILEETFPDIDFYQCYMDPIMQKKGYTPDQKLRRAMFSHFAPEEPVKGVAAILGNDFRLPDDSDICRMLREAGYTVRQIQDCRTYRDYLDLGKAELFIAVYPPGRYGAELAAGKMGRRFLYLPGTFDTEEMQEQLQELQAVLEPEKEDSFVVPAWFADEAGKLEEDLENLVRKIGSTKIQIDGTVHPRPLGLARLLLAHGLHVTKVYLDGISGEEEKAFFWLRDHHPELLLSATIHVRKRTYVTRHAAEGGQEKILAIGQKAAYFAGTPYFVNMVEGNGYQGIAGARAMVRCIAEAYDAEKDIKDLVPRKGLGCESCL